MRRNLTLFRWVLALWLVFSVGEASSHAAEWRGFRGAEKQGWASEASGPVRWETNQNVIWKTKIRGLGYSSPIVSGDSVYVTTAYTTSASAAFRRAIKGVSYVLLALIAFAALPLALNPVGADPQITHTRRSGYLRLLLLCGAFGLLAVLVIFGDQQLQFEEKAGRAWKGSILVVLLCLILGVVQFPLRSRWWLTIAAASLGFAGAALAAFPERKQLFHFDSFSAVFNHVVVASPIVFGLGLLVVRTLAGRGPVPAEVVGSEHRHWRRSFNLGVCLAFAALFFYDTNYLCRTKGMIRAIVSLGLDDGKVRWTCEGLIGQASLPSQLNSLATPTPATDGEIIAAYFGSAGLMCASRNGRLLWTNRELPSEGRFGTATSPLLHRGKVVVISDVSDPEKNSLQKSSYIAAINARTGQIEWRKERRNHKYFEGYISPVMETRGDRDVVWVQGWHDVKGYDLETGEELWTYPLVHDGQHLAASPALADGRLYLLTAPSHKCLDLAKLAGGKEPLVWSRKANEESCASPVVVNGLMFLVTESGEAACLDAATGNMFWERSMEGGYFASIIAAGRQVYFCNDRGHTTVVAADRQFRILAENKVGEDTYASFTPTGRSLLIRTVASLYCIQE